MSEVLSIFNNEDNPAIDGRMELGTKGEDLAAELLRIEGYLLVAANFKVPVGRNRRGVQISGEIDIIALDGEMLCFIEVKTRRSDAFTPVITNVDIRKQRQITRTAKIYRRIFGLRGMAFRFDVVTVLMPKHSDPVVELTKGFWSASKFRKRSWHVSTWDESM